MELWIKKQGLPQEGELTMCEVTKVYNNAVFVNIYEYDKQGFIHISEVSPGRIRNLNDFVKVGKVIVCKVLRINKEKNQVDLSLRRVSEAQRRFKVEQIKQEQKVEKIIDMAAKHCKLKPEEVYKKIADQVLKDYNYIHEFINEYLEDSKFLDAIKLDKKIHDELLELIKVRIKPPIIEIGGVISVISYAGNGIEIIRQGFELAGQTTTEVTTNYTGAGKFILKLKGKDYKSAEKILNTYVETAQKFFEKDKDTTFDFKRVEIKKQVT